VLISLKFLISWYTTWVSHQKQIREQWDGIGWCNLLRTSRRNQWKWEAKETSRCNHIENSIQVVSKSHVLAGRAFVSSKKIVLSVHTLGSVDVGKNLNFLMISVKRINIKIDIYWPISYKPMWLLGYRLYSIGKKTDLVGQHHSHGYISTSVYTYRLYKWYLYTDMTKSSDVGNMYRLQIDMV